jgi:succinylglutamate desuccinylase
MTDNMTEAEFDEMLSAHIAERLKDPAYSNRFCARCRWRFDLHGTAQVGPCEQFVHKDSL